MSLVNPNHSTQNFVSLKKKKKKKEKFQFDLVFPP